MTYLPPQGLPNHLPASRLPSPAASRPPGSILHTVLDRTFQKETLNRTRTPVSLFEGHTGHPATRSHVHSSVGARPASGLGNLLFTDPSASKPFITPPSSWPMHEHTCLTRMGPGSLWVLAPAPHLMGGVWGWQPVWGGGGAALGPGPSCPSPCTQPGACRAESFLHGQQSGRMATGRLQWALPWFPGACS